MNVLLRTGVNGGSSVISIDTTNIRNLDLGKDNNVRVVFTNGEKSYPIIEVLKAPDEFTKQVSELKEAGQW